MNFRDFQLFMKYRYISQLKGHIIIQIIEVEDIDTVKYFYNEENKSKEDTKNEPSKPCKIVKNAR